MTRIAVRIAGLALAMMGAGSGSAMAEQPSAKLCLDPALSTPEIGVCMEKAAAEADDRLNAAYQKALAVIDHDATRKADQKSAWRQRLVAAQRAWLAFRDADCGDLVVSEWNGGSGTGAALAACRYDKSVQRSAELLARYPLR